MKANKLFQHIESHSSQIMKAGLVLALTLLLVLTGCLSLPTQEKSDKSLIILSMYVDTVFPDDVFIHRTDGKGNVLQTYRNNRRRDGYFIFTNLPKGTYIIDHGRAWLEYYNDFPVHLRLTMVGFKKHLIRENDPIQGYYLRFRFNPAVVNSTKINISKAGVHYMGHFSGKIKNIGVYWPYEVIRTEGLRTKEREAKAFQYLREKYPSSEWIKLVP